MRKYGPTRGELQFRLVASLAGLAFLVGAFVYRGLPTGPAMVEIGIIGGGFFGGTAIWSALRLWQGRGPER